MFGGLRERAVILNGTGHQCEPPPFRLEALETHGLA